MNKRLLNKILLILLSFVMLIMSACTNNSKKKDDNSTSSEPASTIEFSTNEVSTINIPKETESEATTVKTEKTTASINENGSYYSKEEVALYIHTYGKLPSNYISKSDAQKLGWTGGSLEKYAPGKAIGGSFFGNYEKLLPTANGRTYTECDIDTKGKSSRGAKRIVFSNDGLIYYTEDHYQSFELLYGEP